MRDKLVGFDLREAPTLVDAWEDDRKAAFLLRDDVNCPLSVDQQVWATLLPEDPLSHEGRGLLFHWDNLAALLRAGSLEIGSVHRPCCVAVTIVWDVLSVEERSYWSTQKLVETVPSTLGPEWTLLGYDVADPWLVSGLSNCGYSPGERTKFRPQWEDKINEYHLFDDAAVAHSFALATNQRVPEHAPFFVYGLFIQDVVLSRSEVHDSGALQTSGHTCLGVPGAGACNR
jgi:hypothetical protein